MKDIYFRNIIIPPIGSILWSIAFLLLIVTSISIIHTLLYLSDRYTTNGKILRYHYNYETERYYPVISFHDKSSIEYTFIDNIGATVPLYLNGTIVQVEYNIHNPQQAGFTNLYFRWGLSFALFTLLCLSFGMGYRFIDRNSR